jgi:hypothetical protein
MAQRDMSRHGKLAWRYSGEWCLVRTGEHRSLSWARTHVQARWWHGETHQGLERSGAWRREAGGEFVRRQCGGDRGGVAGVQLRASNFLWKVQDRVAKLGTGLARPRRQRRRGIMVAELLTGGGFR